MLGWLVVFALLAILGIVLTLASATAVFSMVGLMFALLFFLGLLTRLLRGRSW
jgi:hypothetical protein